MMRQQGASKLAVRPGKGELLVVLVRRIQQQRDADSLRRRAAPGERQRARGGGVVDALHRGAADGRVVHRAQGLGRKVELDEDREGARMLIEDEVMPRKLGDLLTTDSES